MPDPFGFTYLALTKHVRNACDNQQANGETPFNEQWVATQGVDFLRRKHPSYVFDWNEFAPEEFQTGKSGGTRLVDVFGYKRTASSPVAVAPLTELKLMLDPGRGWHREVLNDLLRVACVRSRTNQATRRLVLIVGQSQCWSKIGNSKAGVVEALCPVDRRLSWKAFGLTFHKRSTTLSDRWKAENQGHFDDYLLPLLPPRIKVALVGLSRPNQDDHEPPERQLTARLWRVYPDASRFRWFRTKA